MWLTGHAHLIQVGVLHSDTDTDPFQVRHSDHGNNLVSLCHCIGGQLYSRSAMHKSSLLGLP